ncbi:helix-turn-helix domain-containing protein [Belliella marina]|uniref:Helix-turn-helix domain-containing protein n=1 Tax=Belliella marina TaxID=1644146 RepID=A0ABW4VSF5_9BACT
MEINLKIDVNFLYKKILQESFDEIGIDYSILSPTMVKINGQLDSVKLKSLSNKLLSYGITIISDPKEMIVQKIKNLIAELVKPNQENIAVNTSFYLCENLGYSYGYLASLFSELTMTTIENYVILQKIEMVKHLMQNHELTLTEIAYQLNYSSVAHLSSQFRKTTGLSPSEFQRILFRKKNGFSKTGDTVQAEC